MIGRKTRVNARAPGYSAMRAAVALVLHRGTCAALVAIVVAAQTVGAQAGLTRTDDSPVPRGFARLRVLPSWTRFENRFTGAPGGATSTVPLASVIAADSFGVAQVPGLAASEAALRTLTGDPTFRLSLGQSVSTATTRIVTTAIAAELGLTRRLTIGAVLPIVQSRTELFVALNPKDATAANVGPNPARISGSVARGQAVAVQDQLRAVYAALQTRLDACDNDPSSDPGCANILANRADVVSLIGESTAFRAAVGVLFGVTTTSDVQPFAPLTGATATAIQARLTSLTDRLRGYVGSTADQIVATVPVAVGPAGFGDVQQLLLGGEFGLSPDSLGAVYRFNFGDIELGAKLLVFESGPWAPLPPAPGPWLRARLSVLGVVRLGTGKPTLERLPHRYLEYGTGDGQTDVEGGALMELGLGTRMVVAASGRYTAQLGQVAAGRVPDENGVINPFTPLHGGTRMLGDIVVGEVTPRFLIGRYFGADAHYAIIVRGDDEYTAPPGGGAPVRRGGFTEQRVGVGISYSTLRGSRQRLPRIPLEVSVAHIETIAGSSALVPRASRDQIEVRLFYRLWR